MTIQNTHAVELRLAEQALTTPHVSHTSLNEALAAFQAEIPSVTKSREVTVDTENGPEVILWADLATITERTLPILGKHGLSFSALPTSVDGEGFVLQYALTHESGDSATGTFPLPDPFVFEPQDVSAAITRARRLALCAVTGVAPGGDPIDAPRTTPAPEQAWESGRDWVAEVTLMTKNTDADAAAAAYMALWKEARAAVKAKAAPKQILDAMAAAWRGKVDQTAENDGEAAA